MCKIVGWDIGGAHLKAVLLETGRAPIAMQFSCELWHGLDRLETAIDKALGLFNIRAEEAQHAVTMTGELVDLFTNRREGVIAISNTASKLLGKDTRFYAAGLFNKNHGFVRPESVLTYFAAVASANWCASSSLLANHVKNALFVDIGSTTTDIIPIESSNVKMDGYSDAMRMKSDTLVYTGVVRTPVMALTQKLLFEGAEINVAAEYFATMADVYRLTNDLSPEADLAETADGKGKTVLESAWRLARMVGHDAEDRPLEIWKELAVVCKDTQLKQIKSAILKHLKVGTPIIGAGAGAFLVKVLASELKHEYMTISQALAVDLGENLSVCFPAYAVARLAVEQ